MLYTLSACFNEGIEVMILDRPNPLGDYIGGPIMDQKYLSFLGTMVGEPLFSGMTIAEKAHYIKARGSDFNVPCNCGSKNCAHGIFCSAAKLKKGKLTVIKMKNWNRKKTLTQLGLYKSTSPLPLSPSIQNVASIFEYAVISLATLTNRSFIGFLQGHTSEQMPQRSFKYFLTATPIAQVLSKIKQVYPGALSGITLTTVKEKNQDYLDLTVSDIKKTTPALFGLVLIAQAQEWVPECDWLAFEKASPSSPGTEQRSPTSTVRDLAKLPLAQQKILRKAKWDRLSEAQREQFQKHMGDGEMVRKLFDGDSIDVVHFRNKWSREATHFRNKTKKYYLY
ncbi:MAG: DUF1343 domain-containing protein, partial [Puniceicoccales bacterium]|jgi:uncharacterized protein YbbC (DUF1343 family)|nr:DUF1343 domain-containing protein [Puniceicoccales bacterium]